MSVHVLAELDTQIDVGMKVHLYTHSHGGGDNMIQQHKEDLKLKCAFKNILTKWFCHTKEKNTENKT